MLNPSSVFQRSLNVFVFVSVYLTGSVVFAQVYYSSIAAATAGSGRAAIEPGDALLLNPATLAHLRGKYFFSSFAKNEMAFSLSDNSEDSSFPGGLSYVQTQAENNGVTLKNKIYSLALSQMVAEKFSFGVLANHLTSDINLVKFNQTNADFGLLFTPNDHSGLALVGYNVFGSRKDVPESIRLEPKLGLGYHFIYESFIRLRADVVSAPEYNFGQPALSLGYESYLGKWVIWRIGYQIDKLLDRNLLTGGLGFVGPRFSVTYGYQSNTKDKDDFRHSIDLSIPF